jgi:hypothetical protein
MVECPVGSLSNVSKTHSGTLSGGSSPIRKGITLDIRAFTLAGSLSTCQRPIQWARFPFRPTSAGFDRASRFAVAITLQPSEAHATNS